MSSLLCPLPELPNIELARVDNNDGLDELRVLEMGALKQEPLEDPLRLNQEDIDRHQEEVIDSTRRRLPPRRRGARWVLITPSLT